MPDTNLPAETTKEQDLKTAGQRQINLTWERTQASIAILVVGANVLFAFVSPYLPKQELDKGTLLANAFFLVIGFYFGRTNHARMGDNTKTP